MAEFHIRGRVKREGPLRYVAMVIVVPSGLDDGAYAEMAQESAATHQEAIEKLRAIAVRLGAKLRAAGNEVLAVELSEG
jgi:hypothetical protein